MTDRAPSSDHVHPGLEGEPIYLDYNATTPVAPQVLEAMLPWLRERFGNPSSSHPYGREAHEAVEGAREPVASETSMPARAATRAKTWPRVVEAGAVQVVGVR